MTKSGEVADTISWFSSREKKTHLRENKLPTFYFYVCKVTMETK